MADFGGGWRVVQVPGGGAPMRETMDMVSAVVGLKQAELTSKVQFAVARKLLDNQQLQGQAAVRLIEAAGNIQSKGDALVAAATGLGGRLDSYA